MEPILAAALMALIYIATGRLAARWPETAAGYTTMSPARKREVDLRAAGRCMGRFLTAAGWLSVLLAAAALPGIAEGWQRTISGVGLIGPLLLIVIGAGWASWRYDRKFLKRFKS